MHTHLGQIRMMRGDLTGAIVQYDEMESSFEELTSDPQGLRAICQALKYEVHFEMNEMGVAQSLLDEALKSIEQTDAWLDILAATYRVRARLAFVRSGLPGTLTELAHADAAARDRQMPRLQAGEGIGRGIENANLMPRAGQQIAYTMAHQASADDGGCFHIAHPISPS